MGKQATLAALAAILWTQGGLAQDAAVTAFVDVQVVPMDREHVLAHQTVLVRGNTIVAVGAADRSKFHRRRRAWLATARPTCSPASRTCTPT